MRGLKTLLLFVILVGLLVVCSLPAAAQNNNTCTDPSGANGNCAPSGPHFNLNINGKETCPTQDYKNTNRHVITVKLGFTDPTPKVFTTTTLDKTNKIFLAPTPNTPEFSNFKDWFQVMDGNACDGDGATFMLPTNPFQCPDGTLVTGSTTDLSCLGEDLEFQKYVVYIRELGKPTGTTGHLTTCKVDPGPDGVIGGTVADDVVICSSESVVLVRNTGKSNFREVTRELTTLCLDTGSGHCDTRTTIFADPLQAYYWDYDNTGQRLVQMRFYPCPDAGTSCIPVL